MPGRLAETLMDLWTPLIILWITFPTYVYMAPMNQAQALTTGSPLELSRQSEELRILNRSKRGWVWNQMFVLEEFSGPEPILVGRVSFIFKLSFQGLFLVFKCFFQAPHSFASHLSVNPSEQMVSQLTCWFL